VDYTKTGEQVTASGSTRSTAPALPCSSTTFQNNTISGDLGKQRPVRCSFSLGIVQDALHTVRLMWMGAAHTLGGGAQFHANALANGNPMITQT
jgi:hypothetical protein